MKKIIGIIIIVIIFGVSIYLIIQIPGTSAPNTMEQESGLLEDITEEWLGIFIQGQRIGYSFTQISKNDAGLTVENRTRMTLTMLHEQRTLNTHLYAHTDKEYTLKDFIVEIKTPGHATKVEGLIKGTRLELTSYSQGVPSTQIMTLKEKPYFPDALEEVMTKKNMKPGEEISIPYFDPVTQSSSSATIRMHEKEKVMVMNKEMSGMRVELNYIGINEVLWLDDDYRLIKRASPAMGIEMIPLSQEDALAEIEPTNAFDLLSFVSIKLDRPIPDPRQLSYIKLALKAIEVEDFDLVDDYQILTEEEQIIVENYRADIDALPDLTLPIKEHENYLTPSIYIQCKEPEIIAQANEFIGDAKDAKQAVAKLVSGVYHLVKKNPIASLPSAIDVLRTKEGDCNEHSILFAALARARGIPTKIYVGLINLHGHGYYYHAWCAVWLGKWVPVDPTFNQFPADVGHLKLKEGELSEWAKVMQVVGKLKITVLDYKKE
jgi:hypothetical protein